MTLRLTREEYEATPVPWPKWAACVERDSEGGLVFYSNPEDVEVRDTTAANPARQTVVTVRVEQYWNFGEALEGPRIAVVPRNLMCGSALEDYEPADAKRIAWAINRMLDHLEGSNHGA